MGILSGVLSKVNTNGYVAGVLPTSVVPDPQTTVAPLERQRGLELEKDGFSALSQQEEPLLRDGFLLLESLESLVRVDFRSNRSLRLPVTESFGVGVGDNRMGV